MANSRSAKKAIRKNERRTLVNQARRSRIRTFIRKIELAIAGGDKTAAAAALKAAEPEIMRGAQHGVLPKSTASRKISRLSKRIRLLSA